MVPSCFRTITTLEYHGDVAGSMTHLHHGVAPQLLKVGHVVTCVNVVWYDTGTTSVVLRTREDV